MNRDEILQTLAAHQGEFHRMGVAALYGFGSVARGDAGSSSDVDLLVEFEAPATFNGYMDLREYLEHLLGRRIDLVTHKAIRAEMAAGIAAEVIRVARPFLNDDAG